MKYQIIKEDYSSYYLVQLSGQFNLHVFEECYIDLLNHNQWKPGCGILWDARQCIVEHLNEEDMRTIGMMNLKYKVERGEGKSAWVVEKSVDFGMARMFENINEMVILYNFRVFMSMQDAQIFLANTNSKAGSS